VTIPENKKSKGLRRSGRLGARGVLPRHDPPRREQVDGSREVGPALRPAKLAAAAVLLVTFAWAYGPTLIGLVGEWSREPDYSHGYLVAPLAAFFLWVRRDHFPGVAARPAWGGLSLIAASGLMRFFAARFYIDAIDAWSIIPWLAGSVWLFCGWRTLVWAGPAIGFLWFMVPLPFRAEHLLSYPLQGVATNLSCAILQGLGQPALAEGHTILLGEHQLEVASACSGLRVFMSTVALAFAWMIMVRRTWWENVLLLASTIPIALAANSLRIVLTALLARHVSGEAAGEFAHDFAGWVMIPLAAVLFGMILWYLDRLFHSVEPVDIRSVMRMDRTGKDLR
jgi:exosortase